MANSVYMYHHASAWFEVHAWATFRGSHLGEREKMKHECDGAISQGWPAEGGDEFLAAIVHSTVLS